MIKKNCWEFKNCGRQPGGDNTQELGICPATTNLNANGINDGINAGRACWVIKGTLCNGDIASNFSQKLGTCIECDFYAEVRREQGSAFKTSKQIIKELNGSYTSSHNDATKTDFPLLSKTPHAADD